MRLFAKLTLIGLLMILIPLSISVPTILVRANAQVTDLIVRDATLELEFFLSQARREFETLERLGIATSPFYVQTARAAVLQYGADRSVPGGFLFALDGSGAEVFSGGSIEEGDLVFTESFDPFDWTLGIAIAREFVNGFIRSSTASVVLVTLVVFAVAAGLFYASVRGIIRPIERLEQSAAAIAEGELSARAVVSGGDEIARLGETFNRMAGIVEELTRDLESQVISRTRELQESLDELRAAQELLVQRERMATLGRLVAGVAHEINTPIGIGVTSSTYLTEKAEQWLEKIEQAQQDGGLIDAAAILPFVRDARDASAIVYRSLQRAESLVGTFKNLAVDQVSGEHRVFDLCAYLRDIVHSLEPQAKRSSVTIDLRCDGEIRVNSYPGHIYQIITNLTLNSITHGFPGPASGKVTINAEMTADELTIVHSDNGVGMSAEQLSRIFEPFYTTRLGEGGSGLGMSIVFNTVNQSLGGRIEVSSEPGSGAEFRISVPKVRIDVESGVDPSS